MLSDEQVGDLEADFVDERSSRWMYLALADLDPNPERASLLRSLAGYEEKHASRWETILRGLGHAIPRKERLRDHRILVALARAFGVGAVLPILHRGEVDGIDKYRRQAEEWKDPAAQEAFREILPDEVAHEVDTFGELRRAAATGGALRSAILGANDGLGSVLALTAGVAGATAAGATVVVAGIAGLVAGAVSMAASGYVSVKAEQEVYASQVRLERQALAAAPDAKKDQLRRAYRAKGLTEGEADAVVARLAETPDAFLGALLAEEHGLGAADFEKPSRLAAYTGTAFAVAGALPILPFLLLPVPWAVLASVALAAVALFLAGVVRALSSWNPFLRSGV